MEEWDEAVQDFGAAQTIDPTGFQVQQKLKFAQGKAKAAKKKDYYKILGVEKGCDEAALKKAYRKLALKWHPDKNNETPEQHKRAEKMFKEINEAWAVLSDPQKRKQHDMGMSMEDMQSGGMPGGFPGGMHFNMGGMGGGMPHPPEGRSPMSRPHNLKCSSKVIADISNCNSWILSTHFHSHTTFYIMKFIDFRRNARCIPGYQAL